MALHSLDSSPNFHQRAVKVLRGSFPWDEMVRMREIQSLLRVHRHPSIVALLEVHRSDDGLVSLIFEYMSGGSLQDLIINHRKRMKDIPESMIRSLTQQAFTALSFLHGRHYIHRDIKPENLLLHQDSGGSMILKLADFSLARGFHECEFPLTDYISTRWYRAPEVLLGSIASKRSSVDHVYDFGMDVFAMGCLVAEMSRLNPLLPGQNELHQLQLMVDLLGQLPHSLLAKFDTMARIQPAAHYSPIVSCSPRSRLEKSLNCSRQEMVSFSAHDFAYQALSLDPNNRPSSHQLLQHDFLSISGTSSGVHGTATVNPKPGSSREQAFDPTSLLKPCDDNDRLSSMKENDFPANRYSTNSSSPSVTTECSLMRRSLATPCMTSSAIDHNVVSASPHLRLRIHDNSQLVHR